MRLFAIILLAALLSLFAGLAATIAGSALIPCSSDPAGCGMGEAYRIFAVPVFVLIGMIAFGFTAPGRNRERAVRVTMKVLLLVPVFLIAFGLVADASSGKSTKSSDILEGLQLAVPFWGVILMQWFVAPPLPAPPGAGARIRMKPGTALPWISLLLIVAAVISPLGREILDNAFSGEQLSRSIARFMAMVYLGGLAGLALIEFAIRVALIRRVQRQTLAAERVSD